MQRHAAVDIYDDLFLADRFYTADHLRDMMRLLRDRGVTQVNWVVDTMWSLYHDYPGGMDLLATAVEAAHAVGLPLHAVYKPYESILPIFAFPLDFPRPDPARVPYWVDEMRGIMPVVRLFPAQHPELCIGNLAADQAAGAQVHGIWLRSAQTLDLDLEKLRFELWTSDRNGTWTPYDGPMSVRQRTGWQPAFFQMRQGTIVELADLDIPADQRFFKLEVKGLEQPFTGDLQDLVVLVDADGNALPHTPGVWQGSGMMRKLTEKVRGRIVPYMQEPEVQAILADDERLEALASGFVLYATNVGYARGWDLLERPVLHMALGVEPQMPTILHPGHAAARRHWLDELQFCLDRGVDGICIRNTTHASPLEAYTYIAESPVLDGPRMEADSAALRDALSEGATTFMREAHDLARAAGRAFGVTVITTGVRYSDAGAQDDLMAPIQRDWATWVRDLADYVELRGAMGFRPGRLRQVVDEVAAQCRVRDIPLIYQSNRRNVALTGPYDLLEHEMAWVTRHPGVSAYQLYEVASFSKLDEQDQLVFSDDFFDAVDRYLPYADS